MATKMKKRRRRIKMTMKTMIINRKGCDSCTLAVATEVALVVRVMMTGVCVELFAGN